MVEVQNLNGKRVCDISQDRTVIEIVKKDYFHYNVDTARVYEMEES